MVLGLNVQSLATDQFMTHYWPISCGSMLDEIGSADMSQGNATYFTLDRFGNENASLALNGGWTHVPPGIYFDTPEFTISVWVYPIKVGSYARVIDFGNILSVNALDNIVFRLDANSNKKPALNIFDATGTSIGQCESTNALSNGAWQFLTTTFDGNLESLYINGALVCSQTTNYVLPKIARLYNYIGKSYSPSHGYSWSYIDDLKFYNKSLSQSDILELMNKNGSSGKLVYLFNERLFNLD
jgi:hypothetical protein